MVHELSILLLPPHPSWNQVRCNWCSSFLSGNIEITSPKWVLLPSPTSSESTRMIGELDRSGLKSNWECFSIFSIKEGKFTGRRAQKYLWTNRFREPQLEEEGSPGYTGSQVADGSSMDPLCWGLVSSRKRSHVLQSYLLTVAS